MTRAVLLALICALALSLRLSWIGQRVQEPPRRWSWRAQVSLQPPFDAYNWTHDEYLYYASPAINAFQGRGFFPDYNLVRDGIYVPPPMESLFILAAFEAARRLIHPAWLLGLQALLGVATVALAAEVARRLGGTAAGLVAAVLVAVSPDFVYWTGFLMTESNYLFGLALLLLLLARWSERPSAGSAAAAAVCLGLLSLQRANALLLGAVLAAYALARLRRAGAASAAVFLAVPVAVLLPWLARNLAVYGEPIWVSSNAGIHFYYANHPGLDPRRTPYLEQVLAQDPNALIPDVEARLRGEDGRLRVTYYRYSNVYLRAAREYLLSQPGHFLRNYAVKLANEFFLVQDHAAMALPLPARSAAYRALHALLLVGGLGGLGLLWWLRRSPALAATMIAFAYFALVGGLSILVIDGRYNVVLKLFLAVFLGASAGAVVERAGRATATAYKPTMPDTGTASPAQL